MSVTKHRTLDVLDHKIINVLSKDARVSNRRIALQLGVTEGTIRGRIKRLEESNLTRMTAVTSTRLAHSLRTVLIGIEANHSEINHLCQKLAAMPEIRCVIRMLGRYDLLAIGLFESLEEIANIANNRILALPGVRHVETSIAVKTLKYDHRVAKITSGWRHSR
jgi:DNA-binding Lrp family transcriptional regulator